MADIFISYSKADHALALKLSSFLEAEGWSVWWDKSLAAADLYRDEIMKQLAAARAVIAIWTENSIKSDWVRAEAGTAKKEGKLIPVKTADVAYADIPLPFGEMHTENFASTELIRAAVVAQLAKPAVEPSPTALLAKGLKWELLTWWGIIGGALTLFTAISAALKLADWARLLVQHWKEWTHAFWLWAFGWLGIHLPLDWSFFLTFLSFGSLLTIGQAVKFMTTSRNQLNADKYSGRSFRLISWRAFFCVVLVAAVGLTLPLLLLHRRPSPIFWLISWLDLLAPQVIIVLFARHRLNAAVSLFLLFSFAVIIGFGPAAGQESAFNFSPGTSFAFLLTIWLLPLILLSVAPAKAVSRRLIFLALGLLLLIALNELSKLGLDVTVPKPQG